MDPVRSDTGFAGVICICQPAHFATLFYLRYPVLYSAGDHAMHGNRYVVLAPSSWLSRLLYHHILPILSATQCRNLPFLQKFTLVL